MKVRILTGFGIGIVLLLALLFLPHSVVAALFVAAFAMGIYEIFLALDYEYTPHASELCRSELVIAIVAGISIILDASNYEIGYVIILCALVDVGGFTTGKIAGKKAHKVSQLKNISPNKSWEGYISSVIFSVGFGYLFYWLMREVLPESASVFCLFAWVPAIAGDLFESRIKRCLRISDSGECVAANGPLALQAIEKPIASHGGFLDRVDSFIFTIVAYELFTTLLP